MKNRPDTPKMTNGLIQHIKVEESTSTRWVKREEKTLIYSILNIVFCPVKSALFQMLETVTGLVGENVSIHAISHTVR